MPGEQLDCDGLGWDADAAGRTNVCGSSVLIGVPGSDDMCVRESTFQEAESLCLELGARLCTVLELGVEEGQPGACGYDSAFAWRYESSLFHQHPVSHFLFAHFCAGCSDCSWAAPGGGVTPCTGNSSSGTAGRPGDWYSFVPAAPNMHHEVRLLLDRATAEGAAFLISPDIFDGSGGRVPTSSPPTLHSRPDGAMLRWNMS